MRRSFRSVLLVCCAWPLLSATAHADATADVFRAVDANQFEYARSLARNTGNPLLLRYARWAEMTDENISGVNFNDAILLMPHAANWPMFNRIQLKAEQAALLEAPPREIMLSFCTKYPPISGRGMLACARAKVGSAKQQTQWIHQGWKQGDFTREEENNVLAEFGAQLNVDDYRARIDLLIFDGQTGPASRMLARIPSADRARYDARIALHGNAPDANSKLARVPAAQLNNPGLMFARALWRHRRGMEDGVIELLAASADNPPYPDAWWPLRAVYARTAMRKGHYQTALQILNKSGALKREFLADALWMKGWIYYEYLNNPRAAYKEFYTLYRTVQFPVSKARAAYWASLAARRNGNQKISADWLARASAFPTVFYGQLAQAQRTPNAPLAMPASPKFSADEKATFDKEETIRMIMLLVRYHQEKTTDLFIQNLAETTTNPTRFALLANLARAIGQPYDAVRVAKIALRSNVVLTEHGWPLVNVPQNAAIEAPLSLAIARQESEFNPQAQSPAGARGLMQLLPRTAQETARKIGMGYALPRLFEPEYNLLVGSAYLGRMINAYGGSYIEAIAAYNAGPGNVRKWMAEFGNPGKTTEQSLRWMESIPFAETRNYVQRVLENLQIYRARMKRGNTPPLLHDLVR